MSDLALVGLNAIPIPLTNDKYTLGGGPDCDISIPELGDVGPILDIEIEGGIVKLTLLQNRSDVLFAGMPINPNIAVKLGIGDSFSVSDRTMKISHSLYSTWRIREPGLYWAIIRFIFGLIILSLFFPASIMFLGEMKDSGSAESTSFSFSPDYTFPSPAEIIMQKSDTNNLNINQTSGNLLDNSDGNPSSDQIEELILLLTSPDFLATTAKDIADYAVSAFVGKDYIKLALYSVASTFINFGGFLGESIATRLEVDNKPRFSFWLIVSRGGYTCHIFLVLLYMFTLYGPVSYFLLARGAFSSATLLSAVLRFGIRFVFAIMIAIMLLSIIGGIGFSHYLGEILKDIGFVDQLVKMNVITPFHKPMTLVMLLLTHIAYNLVAVALLVALNMGKLKGYVGMEGDFARSAGTSIISGSKAAVGASGRLLKNVKSGIHEASRTPKNEPSATMETPKENDDKS